MKVNVYKNFVNDKNILPVSKRCLVKKTTGYNLLLKMGTFEDQPDH